MFMLIVISAVITNAGISVFTLTQFNYLNGTYKIWMFIIFQWACFSVQAFLIYLVPNIPWEVQIQQARKNFLVSKIIDKVPDPPDTDSKKAEDDQTSTENFVCCWSY